MATQKSSKTEKLVKKTSIDGKVLPNNYEAEQAVLGCALIDSEATLLVVSNLDEIDFYNETHRNIFSAIKKLFKETSPVDFVSVTDVLEKEGLANLSGGISYVSSLTTIIPSSAGCSHYIEILKRDSVLRQLIQTSGKIIEQAYSNDSGTNLIGVAEKAIYDIAERGQSGSLEKIDKAIEKVIENFEFIHKQGGGIHGLKTGFYQIDKATNGLQNSDLIILAARPGVGKTSLAMNIVTNAAIYSKAKCAVFSLEMGREQLARRMLCSIAKVSMARGLRGELDTIEWNKIWKAKEKFKTAEIYIDDNSMNTPSQVLSKCRKLKREKGLDLVVIDYIGLMKSDEKTDNRQNEVASISRQLKILAKDINVPVITLCQLNRAVEQQDGKDGKPRKPVLSDLRESGSIEQDADMVWFIHRDMTRNEIEKAENKNYTAELIIAKFRNGQPGSVYLGWDGSRTSFVNLERDANEQSLVNAYEDNQAYKRTNKESIEDIKSKLNNIINSPDDEYDDSNYGLTPPPEDEMTGFAVPNFDDSLINSAHNNKIKQVYNLSDLNDKDVNNDDDDGENFEEKSFNPLTDNIPSSLKGKDFSDIDISTSDDLF